MLRLMVVAAIIAILCLPSRAEEFSVIVTDVDMTGFVQVQPAIEQCASGAAFRGDIAMCRNVAAFIGAFVSKLQATRATKPRPADADKPEEQPK